MAELNEQQHDRRLIGDLLKPSYLSAALAGGSAIIITGAAIVSRLYWSSGWLADTLRTIRDSNKYVLDGHTGSGDSPINKILLFVFWACVGLAIYFLAVGIVRAVGEVRELEEESSYLHNDRRAIMRNFVTRFLIRVGALVLLLVVVWLYLREVLPYVLSATKLSGVTAQSLLTYVAGFGLLIVMAHLLTILLRALALRPRLFSADL